MGRQAARTAEAVGVDNDIAAGHVDFAHLDALDDQSGHANDIAAGVCLGDVQALHFSLKLLFFSGEAQIGRRRHVARRGLIVLHQLADRLPSLVEVRGVVHAARRDCHFAAAAFQFRAGDQRRVRRDHHVSRGSGNLDSPLSVFAQKHRAADGQLVFVVLPRFHGARQVNSVARRQALDGVAQRRGDHLGAGSLAVPGVALHRLHHLHEALNRRELHVAHGLGGSRQGDHVLLVDGAVQLGRRARDGAVGVGVGDGAVVQRGRTAVLVLAGVNLHVARRQQRTAQIHGDGVTAGDLDSHVAGRPSRRRALQVAQRLGAHGTRVVGREDQGRRGPRDAQRRAVADGNAVVVGHLQRRRSAAAGDQPRRQDARLFGDSPRRARSHRQRAGAGQLRAGAHVGRRRKAQFALRGAEGGRDAAVAVARHDVAVGLSVGNLVVGGDGQCAAGGHHGVVLDRGRRGPLQRVLELRGRGTDHRSLRGVSGRGVAEILHGRHRDVPRRVPGAAEAGRGVGLDVHDGPGRQAAGVARRAPDQDAAAVAVGLRRVRHGGLRLQRQGTDLLRRGVGQAGRRAAGALDHGLVVAHGDDPHGDGVHVRRQVQIVQGPGRQGRVAQEGSPEQVQRGGYFIDGFGAVVGILEAQRAAVAVGDRAQRPARAVISAHQAREAHGRRVVDVLRAAGHSNRTGALHLGKRHAHRRADQSHVQVLCLGLHGGVLLSGHVKGRAAQCHRRVAAADGHGDFGAVGGPGVGAAARGVVGHASYVDGSGVASRPRRLHRQCFSGGQLRAAQLRLDGPRDVQPAHQSARRHHATFEAVGVLPVRRGVQRRQGHVAPGAQNAAFVDDHRGIVRHVQAAVNRRDGQTAQAALIGVELGNAIQGAGQRQGSAGGQRGAAHQHFGLSVQVVDAHGGAGAGSRDGAAAAAGQDFARLRRFGRQVARGRGNSGVLDDDRQFRGLVGSVLHRLAFLPVGYGFLFVGAQRRGLSDGDHGHALGAV